MEEGRFPNKLKMFRHCQGYSQKKVARLLGLADTSTISRWENGSALPTLLQLFRLGRLYHAQPNELYEPLWQQVLEDSSFVDQNDVPFNNHFFHL